MGIQSNKFALLIFIQKKKKQNPKGKIKHLHGLSFQTMDLKVKMYIPKKN
jgi:hypothetical protein